MRVHDRPIRIAIDVRLPPDRWGGVQQVAQGLATGLAALEGPERYEFIGYPDAGEWLDPFIAGPVRRVEVRFGSGRTRARRAYDAITGRWGVVDRLVQSVGSRVGLAATGTPRSDGTIERLGVDVVHFLLPQAYSTQVPSIYQVHDLLHLHHPDLFSPLHRQYRERTYLAFARQARLVSTMTEWGRRQIVDQLGLPPSLVAVVPWAPVVGELRADAGQEADDVLGAELPDRFLLYPSQTWPHKNHLGLLDAIAILRDRGVMIDLVCTGHETPEFARLRARASMLNLEHQVRFLGRVPAAQLAGMYRRATALVFPSRFEGFGLPILEAFAAGLPVAASNAAAIPEVAGGAALLFDPDLPSAIANAIGRISADETLRDELRMKGLARARSFSWTESAKRFRALYRHIGSVPLTDEDVDFLRAPVLVP